MRWQQQNGSGSDGCKAATTAQRERRGGGKLVDHKIIRMWRRRSRRGQLRGRSTVCLLVAELPRERPKFVVGAAAEEGNVPHHWLRPARSVHGAVLPILAGERRRVPHALHKGEWSQPGRVDDRAWDLAQSRLLLCLVLRAFEAAAAPPQRGH
eukprot:scaffold98151_cov79-Phaeocystis_antarctica.AAC.4